MINKDIIEAFSVVAKEKNIDRTNLSTIIEELFTGLIEKKYGADLNWKGEDNYRRCQVSFKVEDLGYDTFLDNWFYYPREYIEGIVLINQNKKQNVIHTEVNSVWTIANNNLNAADIDGSTIASLLHLRIQKKLMNQMTL